MSRLTFAKVAFQLSLLVFCLSVVSHPTATYGQNGDNIQQLKQKVEKLIAEHKYTEALPLLEKLVLAEPDNPQVHFELGFALLGETATAKDESRKKALAVRARNSFIKSKELGNQDPLVDAMIESIAPDGSAFGPVSKNNEASKLMEEGEALFSTGKLEDALKKYQKALELDPALYEAAVFSGDVHTQLGDFAQAEVWYQKAIVIDPKRETAYRYSATPFMKQKKYDQARDRYIEAFITEPYNRFTVAGISQWAQVTGTGLAHPEIEVPTNVTRDEKGEVKISLDASMLTGGKDDGSYAWISYGATRKAWVTEKFAKVFPQEKTYRRSLTEEAEALRSVLTIVTGDKKVKNLSPSLAKLKRLNDDGLLEAYILFVRVDEGIAQDFPSYLAQSRDKLRRYMVEYVVTGGGK